MAAEYYTKTIINSNVIIVETMIGSNKYYDTINRGLHEDIDLGTLATAYKAKASVMLNVDANSDAATSRIAKNTADAAR